VGESLLPLLAWKRLLQSCEDKRRGGFVPISRMIIQVPRYNGTHLPHIDALGNTHPITSRVSDRHNESDEDTGLFPFRIEIFPLRFLILS
jgi:hypothetical protein